MRASDILAEKGGDVVCVPSTATLGDAIDTLAKHKIGAVLVSDGGDGLPVGILSERDVVRQLAGAPTGHRDTPVANVMTADLFTCTPQATVDDLLDLMTARRIRHVPIMADERLAGLVSIGDVVKHRIREAVGEAEALKSYITAG